MGADDGGDDSEDHDPSSHRLRGPIDADALVTTRGVFDRMLPLSETNLDDPVDPTVLTVELTPGVAEDVTGRFDVQWTTADDYKYHYTEPDLDFRWGRHPHGRTYDVPGDAHSHPPPAASSDPSVVEPSQFRVHRPAIVTRGVITNWEAAVENGLEVLNEPE
ncbi:hypothetical protein [Natrarchaeobaculum aegyptiacum]|uniref:Uncharacterized protein n=1 Tax=Natrarchaeobaculum aegyptiacum TaxID=745377 RepID=A0A2Z2HWS6_9EURY|nr:hypothetical protein [Natrarchaeobaculum aegyptiacum]ARS91671.1 hypothetical protein B1756_04170 [Natrarchaeobaculum aegyptiacum]